MLKKLISLLLTICMLFCLSACGTTATSSNPITPSKSQTDTAQGTDENILTEENTQVSSNIEETNENDTQTQTTASQSKTTSTTNQPTHTHSYSNATCTSPKTCLRCGEKIGLALEHSYSAATCIAPKTCVRCGNTSGSALGHKYIAATCTSPKSCERCNSVFDAALGHNFQSGSCSRCGKLDRTYLIEDIDYLRCNSALYYEDTPVTDNSGNVYSEHLNFYGYAFNYEPSISFDLRCKYSIFNATIFLPYDDRGTHLIGYVKIYGDDKLLYQSEEITMGFKTTNIKIDISGISILEIEMDPQNSINNECVPYLTNAYLEK